MKVEKKKLKFRGTSNRKLNEAFRGLHMLRTQEKIFWDNWMGAVFPDLHMGSFDDFIWHRHERVKDKQQDILMATLMKDMALLLKRLIVERIDLAYGVEQRVTKYGSKVQDKMFSRNNVPVSMELHVLEDNLYLSQFFKSVVLSRPLPSVDVAWELALDLFLRFDLREHFDEITQVVFSLLKLTQVIPDSHMWSIGNPFESLYEYENTIFVVDRYRFNLHLLPIKRRTAKRYYIKTVSAFDSTICGRFDDSPAGRAWLAKEGDSKLFTLDPVEAVRELVDNRLEREKEICEKVVDLSTSHIKALGGDEHDSVVLRYGAVNSLYRRWLATQEGQILNGELGKYLGMASKFDTLNTLVKGLDLETYLDMVALNFGMKINDATYFKCAVWLMILMLSPENRSWAYEKLSKEMAHLPAFL